MFINLLCDYLFDFFFFWFMQKFENLKILKFDYCEYLIDTPDVSCLPNLEKISFELCKNLVTIHNSTGFLNKLKFLSVEGCCKLRYFPPLELISLENLEIENLKYLSIYGTSIEGFPVSFQNLTGLCKISIEGHGMFRLPSFILKMPKLSCISVNGYSHLLPKKNDKLSFLVSSTVQYLDLIRNNLSDECLPILLRLFANVTYLYLSGNNFKILRNASKNVAFYGAFD